MASPCASDVPSSGTVPVSALEAAKRALAEAVATWSKERDALLDEQSQLLKEKADVLERLAKESGRRAKDSEAFEEEREELLAALAGADARVEALTTELARSKEECSSVQEVVKELQDLIRKEDKARKDERDRLENRVMTLQLELARGLEASDEAERETALLREDLSRLRTVESILTEKLSAMQERVHELETTAAATAATEATATVEAVVSPPSLPDSAGLLSSPGSVTRVHDLEAEVARLQQELERRAEELTASQTKLSAVEERATKAEEKTARAVAAITEFRTEFRTLRDAMQASTEEIAALRVQVAKAESDRDIALEQLRVSTEGGDVDGAQAAAIRAAAASASAAAARQTREEAESLRSDIARLQGELDSATERLEELGARASAAEASAAAAKGKLQQEVERVERRNKDIATLEHHVEKERKLRQEAESVLATKMAELAQLTEAVEEARSDTATQVQQLTAQHQEASVAWKESMGVVKEEVETLKVELDMVIQRLSESQEHVRVAEENASQLESRLASTEEALLEAEARVDAAETRANETLQDVTQQSAAKLADARDLIARLETRIVELEVAAKDSSADVLGRLKEAEAQNKELTASLLRAKVELEEAQALAAAATEQEQVARLRIVALDESNGALADEGARLTMEVKAMVAEMEQMTAREAVSQERVNDLEAHVQELEKQLEGSSDAVKELTARVEESRRTISSLQDELDDVLTSKARLSDEYDTLVQGQQSSVHESSEMSAALAAAHSEVQRLATRLELARVEAEEREVQYENDMATTNVKVIEMERLREEAQQALEAQLDEVRAERARAAAAREGLVRKVEELEQALKNAQATNDGLMDIKKELAAKDAECERAYTALTNLQMVLDQANSDSAASYDRYAKEMASAQMELTALRSEAELLRRTHAEAEEKQAAYVRSRDQLIAAQAYAQKLEAENDNLRRGMETTMAKLKQFSGDEHMIDRRLVVKLLETYLLRPAGSGKDEVVDLMMKLLQFSEDQKERILEIRRRTHEAAGLGALKSAWAWLQQSGSEDEEGRGDAAGSGGDSSKVSDELKDVAFADSNLADMWVNFLLKEAEKQVVGAMPKGVKQGTTLPGFGVEVTANVPASPTATGSASGETSVAPRTTPTNGMNPLTAAFTAGPSQSTTPVSGPTAQGSDGAAHHGHYAQTMHQAHLHAYPHDYVHSALHQPPQQSQQQYQLQHGQDMTPYSNGTSHSHSHGHSAPSPYPIPPTGAHLQHQHPYQQHSASTPDQDPLQMTLLPPHLQHLR